MKFVDRFIHKMETSTRKGASGIVYSSPAALRQNTPPDEVDVEVAESGMVGSTAPELCAVGTEYQPTNTNLKSLAKKAGSGKS